MKWIILLPAILFLSACGCCVNQAAIGYPQVIVSQPYQAVTIVDTAPVDVISVTTPDYYY